MMEILYEDNHLIAINKSVSEIVQGDKTGDEPLSEKVKSYLKKRYNKPGNVFLGVVHRLDRPVSGVVIFARTGKALVRLNEMFRTRQVKKDYWAVVRQLPKAPEGNLEHFLIRNQKQNKSYAYTEERKESKKALLSYSCLAHSDGYHLLRVELATGRHHQIRTQLAAVGSPIKGDLKYGYSRSNPNAGIHLHARSLSFIHPVSKETITIVAPTPQKDKLWQFFETEIRNKKIQ